MPIAALGVTQDSQDARVRMHSKGFTTIELIIVCLIITLVAAIAIPNYRASQDRAREGRVKANMHTFQLAAEDFRVRSDSGYAERASDVASYLSEDFPNPFDRSRGENAAWEDRPLMSEPSSSTPGIVSYADSMAGSDYAIKGYGRDRDMGLVLVASLPNYADPTQVQLQLAPDGGDTRRRFGPSGSESRSPGSLTETR